MTIPGHIDTSRPANNAISDNIILCLVPLIWTILLRHPDQTNRRPKCWLICTIYLVQRRWKSRNELWVKRLQNNTNAQKPPLIHLVYWLTHSDSTDFRNATIRLEASTDTRQCTICSLPCYQRYKVNYRRTFQWFVKAICDLEGDYWRQSMIVEKPDWGGRISSASMHCKMQCYLGLKFSP